MLSLQLIVLVELRVVLIFDIMKRNLQYCGKCVSYYRDQEIESDTCLQVSYQGDQKVDKTGAVR